MIGLQARLQTPVRPDVNKLLHLPETMEEEVQLFFEEAIPAAPAIINCHLCGTQVSWVECQHFGLASGTPYRKIANHLEAYWNNILPQILDEYKPIEINGRRYVHVSLTRHMANRNLDPRNLNEKWYGKKLEQMVDRHVPSIPLFPVSFDTGDMELMGRHVFRFLASLDEKWGRGKTETTLVVAFGSSSPPSIAFQTGYYYYTKQTRPNWNFFQLNFDNRRTIKGKISVGYHAHPDPNMLFQHERAGFVSKEDYKELSDKFEKLNEQLEETRAKLKMIHEISDLDPGIQESE